MWGQAGGRALSLPDAWKKSVTFSPEPGWGLLRNIGFCWKWRSSLTSICPTTSLAQQCWTSVSGSCCPSESASGSTGVEISFGYDLHVEVRGSWVFLITYCPFSRLSISSLFLLSCPFLPLSFLPIIFSLYYPLAICVDRASTLCSLYVSVCWLSPLKRQILTLFFVEFIFWNFMCQIG